MVLLGVSRLRRAYSVRAPETRRSRRAGNRFAPGVRSSLASVSRGPAIRNARLNFLRAQPTRKPPSAKTTKVILVSFWCGRAPVSTSRFPRRWSTACFVISARAVSVSSSVGPTCSESYRDTPARPILAEPFTEAGAAVWHWLAWSGRGFWKMCYSHRLLIHVKSWSNFLGLNLHRSSVSSLFHSRISRTFEKGTPATQAEECSC